MTLANFNSNFNWQLRMLKEAADCCGIVPDLPPAPVVDCYWYTKVHDNSCSFFNDVFAAWDLNGQPTFNWSSLMVNPPYGTTGYAIQYSDNSSGCGFSSYADFYLWTVVPSTISSLPQLTGIDSFGNPVFYNMFGPICTPKCYVGTLFSSTGTSIINAFNTAELNVTDYSIFIDLLDPAVNFNFTNQLASFYPAPPLSVEVTVVAPNEYSIKITGLYSSSNTLYFFLDDFVSVGELYEVPC